MLEIRMKKRGLNMFRRLSMGFLSLSLITQVQAFPCYITMVKDKCWIDYDVSVNVVDVMTEKLITTMLIPTGKSWERFEFSCNEKQTVLFKATFSPVIWEADEDKAYFGKRYWSFPEEIKKDQTAWNMTICYPEHFAGTPSPANVSGGCGCETSNIPALKPR